MFVPCGSILLAIFLTFCNIPSQNQTAAVIFRPNSTLHGVHFAFFPGKPRWRRAMPMVLTYAFMRENWRSNLRLRDVKLVFRNAFSKWAHVIPVSFHETQDYAYADIKIGFYSGDHSDGQPFDGVLGVLAHSFSPEIGRLHLDAAETWALDFQKETSPVAVDLESVATHEIGHLLGLGHSPVTESVMYPSLKPREKKANLEADDVAAVQALYGSNPNFKFQSLALESHTSSSSSSANLAPHVSTSVTTWTTLPLSFIIFLTWRFIVFS